MPIRRPTGNLEKPGWLSRHKQKLIEAQRRRDDINLVFIGDSITQAWEDKGKREWKKYFAPYGALNLGYGGDRTEHVLWRMEQGELDGLTPKLIVLMIGTNNTGHHQDPPKETSEAIVEIVNNIHVHMPNTRILLHAIMPCGQYANDPLRLLNNEVNRLIKPLAKRKYITWLDLSELFIDESGIISESVMNDYLHPNVFQYKRWAEALSPIVNKLMAT